MARNSLKNVMRLIDVKKNELSPEKSFLEDLKRSIEIENDKGRRLPSKTYKPSGMNCIRASYYQIMGIKPDSGVSSYIGVGICNSGTDIHVRIQTAVDNMKEHGIDCEYVDVAKFVKSRKLDYLDIVSKQGVETKLYHKVLNMSFLCDGIVKYKNHYYILELKTETSRKWWDRNGVDPGHYNQATAYSVALGLDDVLFIYINRDILDMKSFMFHVTDEMKQNLIGYIEECDGYVKRFITPPKPEDITKKTCEYCGYRQTCRKDG